MINKPLWADLHNHNGVGYGKGTPERSYAIARGSLLDVYCFTPHGFWHDMPQDDPSMVEFHREGFQKVRDAWPAVKQLTDTHYSPGEFVTFFGYEWHSSQYGDYHMLFPNDEVEIFRGESVANLQSMVRENGGIMIPHHVGYRHGWRGADWPSLAADVTPVVDVFSEHGCSMESEFQIPMLLHSMGGSEKSQTVMEQLKAGLVAGLTASTDNHHGHPASYGEGLTGIWADDLTRESVLDAFHKRHTFAVTGDRISVMLRMGDAIMGDIVPASSPRGLSFDVDACGSIDSVRVIKNGIVAADLLAGAHGDKSQGFVVRLSFGWDSMGSKETTDWNIRLKAEGGEIEDVLPQFAGGGGSFEKTNAVTSRSSHEVAITAFTSRRNAYPISEIVLRVAGDDATEIAVDVESRYGDIRGGCRLQSSLKDLLTRDKWGVVTDIFSAPKIRLGQAHRLCETRLSGSWTDPSPGLDDWYLLRVQQKNGHTAWSSPIWCRG